MLATGLDALMVFNPAAVRPETPLAEAAQILEEFDARHVPVVDGDGQIVGMLSANDVRRCVRSASAQSKVLRTWPPHSAGVVADAMHASPIALEREATPQSVVETMLRCELVSVPIVEDGRLIGMITSADVLRDFAYSGAAAGEELVSKHMHDADAQIEWNAPLDEAARRMLELGTVHLAVLRGDCPVGVISKRSLRILPGELTASGGVMTVAHVAHAKAPALSPNETLAAAAARLVDAGAAAAPVIDRQNLLVGLLTEDQILAAISRN